MTLSFALFSDLSDKSRALHQRLSDDPRCTCADSADVFVVIGGDGFLLRVLQDMLNKNISKPVYGINRGTMGFLMNTEIYDDKIPLQEKLEQAHTISLTPLVMSATTVENKIETAFAINDVSLLRQTPQSAKIQVHVDRQERLEALMGDGILVATPAGSTAYNFSAHGQILPLNAPLLALTPINPFRPRRWRGALLPHTATISFTVLDPEKRPVSATADFLEIRNVVQVSVREAKEKKMTLLFDPERNLENRILGEQFMA